MTRHLWACSLWAGAALAALIVTTGVARAGETACAAPEELAGDAAIPGGAFRMGSDVFYPEEAPSRMAEVAPFRIDRSAVTNAQFAAFVAETGYVTLAERTPDPADFPGVDLAELVPGSAVFIMPERGEAGRWSFAPGAHWRAPMGPGSDLAGLESHPVVHVAFEDAEAYAAWAGRRIPSEAEWERAARAGHENAIYEWGAELTPDDEWRANTWQGPFPIENRGEDGFIGTAPVGCFPPSDYGLYDMTGNVWEWTADVFGGDPALGVIKGGSFLCAENYCARYRPPARQSFERNFSASHVGFRTAGD